MKKLLLGLFPLALVLAMVYWSHADTLIAKSGAPITAPYLTKTPVAGLTAEEALSTKATGCMASTTSTGAVNTRVLTGTANEITVTSGDCSGTPTFSLPAVIDLSEKTSFRVPNSAAPTTNAFGHLAGDNNAWATGRGALQHYDGTANTFLLGVLASDTPASGECPKWNTGGTITWESCAGGGSSTGAAGALQASNGSGGFVDSGVTAVAGVITATKLNLTGGTLGEITWLSGSTQAAPSNAGEVKFYINSTTLRWETIANGGTAKDYVTTADTQTLANKLIRHSYWEEVAICNNGTASTRVHVPATNGAVAGCDAGTNKYSAYMAFNDTTDQGIQGSFILQAGYSGGIDWKFRYKMATATTGTVGFCARFARLPTGASPDPAFHTQATGNCVSGTVPGTAGHEAELTITNATCTSCVAGDRIIWWVQRDADGSAVSDSATGDARLMISGPMYASVE